MTERGVIAEATECDTGACYTRHVIVRGHNVKFVSEEQVRRSGARRYVRPTGPNRENEVYWQPRIPRADVTFPTGFVVVPGLLDRCDFYIVRLHRGGAKNAPADVIEDAKSYFIDQYDRPMQLEYGEVEIPEGPWRKLARVRLIRYKRRGFAKPFEHLYDPPVEVQYSERVLGYRLPLPDGCIVDDHGFRWP